MPVLPESRQVRSSIELCLSPLFTPRKTDGSSVNRPYYVASALRGFFAFLSQHPTWRRQLAALPCVEKVRELLPDLRNAPPSHAADGKKFPVAFLIKRGNGTNAFGGRTDGQRAKQPRGKPELFRRIPRGSAEKIPFSGFVAHGKAKKVQKIQHLRAIQQHGPAPCDPPRFLRPRSCVPVSPL